MAAMALSTSPNSWSRGSISGQDVPPFCQEDVNQDDTVSSVGSQKQLEEQFMERLKNVPPGFYFLQEDLILNSHIRCRALARDVVASNKDNIDYYKKLSATIKPMDLGDIKHYSYDYLQRITGSFCEENFLGNNFFGRLYLGKIHKGSEIQNVIVKTWDFSFPPTTTSAFYVHRIHDEIELLRHPNLTSIPCLVKLIGFHCDEKLAVIYEGGPMKILSEILMSDEFAWSDRMEVALHVGRMLKVFHGMDRVHGGINSRYMLIDESYRPKSCAFDLYSYFEGGWAGFYDPLVCSSYGVYVDRCLQAPWSMRHDVFAYGILLLELITKQQFNGDDVKKWTNYEPSDRRSSVLHASFQVDGLSASRITRLAMNCLEMKSVGQPVIEDVVAELEELVSSIPANKLQKTCH
ncbi:Serine/threonine protein kinase [Handroanthus impetiginosus]|uniref:Serine/threonine protein kinase n=1 Tax=Handroanthus impetiginosus TaxID=429701 RepID=A0A2G9I0D7_9LAMI|nr:Serine/threonine protein kinase [Handroanthus impetiginosus]